MKVKNGQIVYKKGRYSIQSEVTYRVLFDKKPLSCYGWGWIKSAKKEIREDVLRKKGKRLCKCGRIIY